MYTVIQLPSNRVISTSPVVVIAVYVDFGQFIAISNLKWSDE
jgi:hypothetical protein